MRFAAVLLLVFQSGSLPVLAQQDLQLWYDRPAVKWTEALPIGNGRLGAMIFGGVHTDRVQFNEETLWTGGPRDYHRPGAHLYLDSIRQLLQAGKQKEAEQLAEKHFMGVKSSEGEKQQWVNRVRAITSSPSNPAAPSFNDDAWKEMEVPSYEGWEAIGFEGLDGALWFRTEFILPEAWKGKELVLDLNRIREHDFTYINGKLVGSMESNEARRYRIPADVLVPGKNVIAIQVLNYFDKGGLAGYKDTSRSIGIYPLQDPAALIPLAKKWKYFIQDDAPPAVPRYQADYQPFADLWLTMKEQGQHSGYKRVLDLSTAQVTTSYTINGIHYRRTYLASYPDQALVMHLQASKPGQVSFEALLNTPHKDFVLQTIDNSTISLSLKVRNGALEGVCHLRVVIKKGKLKVNDHKLFVEGADEATLYLTAATNYKNYRDVSADPASQSRNALTKLNGKHFMQVKAAHTAWYKSYFNRFSISLGKDAFAHLPTDERLRRFNASNDPAFVALYAQYGRYLLISSSAPGTRPANLQGIWNDLLAPPWGSKYTTNINAEMNYWPAELLNLSPMHQPFFTMIHELSEAGRATAKAHYNAPGWVVHHNTDLWRGTAPINAANHGIWVGGSGWLSYHLWEHFLFTRDKNFLQQAYPVMKEAARFYQHFLVRDAKTGWLISSPSNSPEQGGLVAGPSMDHQIIRALFKAVIEAATLLNKDQSWKDSLQQTLKQVAPDQVGRHGQLQEWLQDLDDPNNRHRHVSHLWAVYPGKEINWDASPELMRAARQSLLFRGDAATGWSLGWKLNLWARFRDGDHAWDLIRMLLSPAEKGGAGSYPNLFDAHPPFQIDGNFGGAAGIGELLVQSHMNGIDLLPALPPSLPEGEVRGIRARGGFELQLKWKDGQLQNVRVLSLAGQQCTLRYKGQTRILNTQKGKIYTLNGSLQ